MSPWVLLTGCAVVVLLYGVAVARRRAALAAVPAPTRRRPIPIELRRRVLRRDGWRCPCGAIRDLTVDHIRPLARGGTDAESNLRTLCRSCNSSKGARVYGKAA